MKTQILLLIGICFMLPNLFAQDDFFPDIEDDISEELELVGQMNYNRYRDKAEEMGYSSVLNFYEGIAPAEKNGKWGYINSNIEVVVPFKYDDIDYFKEDRAAVSIGKKWGFIDKKGVIIIPLKYDDIHGFNDGKAYVSLNKKWGMISSDGTLLTAIKYDKIRPFADGSLLAWVQIDERVGFINTRGEEITGLIYDGVDFLNKNTAVVHKNQKYGIVDYTGKEIVPLRYESIFSFKNGDNLALTENKIIQLSQDGKEKNASKDSRINAAKLIYRSLLKKQTQIADRLGFKWALAVAKEGDHDAIVLISRMYDQGKGTDRNHDKANEWLKKSIDAGNVNALTYMGERYEKGIGVKQDYMKSLKHLAEAVQKNADPIAVSNLRDVYKKAMQEFVPKAERGDATAMAKVGILFMYAGDFESSLKWLQEADEKDSPEAAATLGLLYQNGKILGKDYSKAAELLEKAIKKDFEEKESAYQILFELYDTGGYGLQRNEEKARKYKDLAEASK